MTFLPVVERELRVAARLPGTHWVRLVAAFIALGIGGWIMAIPYLRNTPGVLGMALFVSMSILVNCYALIIFFAGGLPLIGAIVRNWTGGPLLNPLFIIFSPGYCTFMAFDASFKNAANFNFFYPAVGAIHALTWLLLFVACLIVPRTWQDKALSAPPLERACIWTNLVFGVRPERAAPRSRRVDGTPFCWPNSR